MVNENVCLIKMCYVLPISMTIEREVSIGQGVSTNLLGAFKEKL